MKSIKRAIDPNNIMNPHKIMDWEEGFLVNLRYPTDPKRKLTGHLAKYENDLVTCTLCGYCKFLCPPFIDIFWDSASARGRNILSYGILEKEIEIDDSVAERLYQCTMCRDCYRRCPSKIEVYEIVKAARADLVEAGFAYDTHKGMVKNVIETGNIFGDREIAFPVQEGEIPLFIGCQYLSRPNKTRMWIRILEKLGIKPKVQKEICCGYPLEVLGFKKEFSEHKEKFLASFSNAKEIITLCPTCTVWLQEGYEFNSKHVLQVILEKLPEKKLEIKATYHDPCDLSRGAKIINEPREVLKKLGIELVEMPKSRDTSRCCGGGGGILMSDETLSYRIAERRIREALSTDTGTLVTACPTCEQVLKKAATAVSENGEGSITVRNIEDILWKALK